MFKKPEKDAVISGTFEWAVSEINCCIGCSHGCRYCYAKHKLVRQKGQLTEKQWQKSQTLEENLQKDYPLYDGQVMFPTTHDITPDNLEDCLQLLGKLLDTGNRVLVVTKPHRHCVEKIANSLSKYRDQLLFRFTITAQNQRILDYWEPQAPSYKERVQALEFAFANDFATSVSIEPMLDTKNAVALVRELLPFVTHSIWLGKMNKIDQRVEITSPKDQEEVAKIKQGQTDDKILDIYNELRFEEKVFWKESIKKVVGIDLLSSPGQDR